MTDHTDIALHGAFGDKGTNVNHIPYSHPYADQILGEARDILCESKTGAILIKVMNHHKLPVHIIKGTQESGYSPEMNTIFMQVPGNVSKATPDFIINLIKALRDADQELSGHKAPDPLKDVIAYAGFMHARNLASITAVCEVMKELTNSSFFPVLLDSLASLGFNRMYKAFLDGASKEELYMEYATAYDNQREGRI